MSDEAREPKQIKAEQTLATAPLPPSSHSTLPPSEAHDAGATVAGSSAGSSAACAMEGEEGRSADPPVDDDDDDEEAEGEEEDKEEDEDKLKEGETGSGS